MKDLIEALQILLKYNDSKYPTGCEHDVLYVCLDTSLVSIEDTKRLEELSFYPYEDGFQSTRFGSC